MEINLEPLTRLNRDLRQAALTLSKAEVRFLVDMYYMVQEWRIQSGNRVRSLRETGEPHGVIAWFHGQSHILENQIKKALDYYSQSTWIGEWARSIVGIGPVIASALEAYIDIEKAPTVGHVWRYAGLDPTCEWKKGNKRPWNAGLKTICWKIGESFVKVSGREHDIYGKYYLARKEYEQEKNKRGDYADQAMKKLEKFRIGKDTDAYNWYINGQLPPGHIHARAKRWAVKLFLAHWHHAYYRIQYGSDPPLPYPIEFLGHEHYIPPPNLE